MYLNNKPGRSLTNAKSRINAHTQRLENIESRKRSPESYNNGPPSPASSNDVMVFTSSHHGNRPLHGARIHSSPEYPNLDEMYRYVQDVWDQKMSEVNAPNSKIKCLNLSKPMHAEKTYHRKETSPSGSQPATPSKHRHSPQHTNHRDSKKF